MSVPLEIHIIDPVVNTFYGYQVSVPDLIQNNEYNLEVVGFELVLLSISVPVTLLSSVHPLA